MSLEAADNYKTSWEAEVLGNMKNTENIWHFEVAQASKGMQH